MRPGGGAGGGGHFGAPVGVALMLHLLYTPSAAEAESRDDEPIVTAANNVGWSAAPVLEDPMPGVPAQDRPPPTVAEVLAAGPAVAVQQTQAARVLTPIQGPLTLEGRYLGDISGEVGLDGDGVIDAARLLALLGEVVSPGTMEALRDRVAGRERVPFADLRGDGFSLEFDTLSLTFLVHLGSGARAQRRIAFGGAQVIDPSSFDEPARFSAAANVSIGQTYDHETDDFGGLRGGADILVNWGGFDGVTLSTGFDYDEDVGDDRFRRHEIRLTKDLFDSAIRLTGGEFSPPIMGFQGSDRIVGISAARSYSVIRPFQNIRPAGRRDFVLERQSFVEVEVNGVVVERLQLEPGPYSLSDFPFAQGGNTVRLLADDGTGRREIAVFDLFGGAGLLDPGIVDFGVSLGAVQEGGEFRYDGGPALSAFYRQGLTDSLSAGGAVQWVDERWMVEGSATWGASLGLLELGIAASGNGTTDTTGYAASIDYLNEVSLFERDDTRIIVTGEVYSRDFQDAFERFSANPEAWRVAAQVSSRLDRYTINLGAGFVKGRDARGDESSLDFSVGRSFGRYGISVSLGHREYEDREADTRIGLALTVGLGRRWNAQARFDSDQDYRELTLRRSSNGELNDLSGGLRVTQDSGRNAVGGDLRYINNRFDAEIISNRLASRLPGGPVTAESLWRASSLFALSDGVFAIGRPAREGFVIARLHSSLKDSKLALTDTNGREIARADWLGPAVAPVDRAYSVYRLETSVDPLPEGYDLGAGVLNLFPGYGSGYAVTVGSDASRTALGVLVLPDGTPAALISGTIESMDRPVAGEPKVFFTNRGGRFVGDGLAPGRYRLVMQGVAVGEFVISEEEEGVVDVGRIQIVRP